MDLKEKLKMLPDDPGVYLMKDSFDNIIYVGKAKNLKKRVRQYFGSYGKSTRKVESMVSHIKDFEYIIVENEVESLILESNLIKAHNPKYNILLRDDKQYPYIKIGVYDRFPKVEKVRKVLKDGGKYFGPYPNAMAVNEAIEIFKDLYKIRDCNLNLNKDPLNFRLCLNFFIDKCKGPCKGHIDEGQYKESIDEISAFLEGHSKNILAKIEEKMVMASKNLDFEKAALYRDQINNLQALLEKQIIDRAAIDENRDVIAFARGTDQIIVQIFFIRKGKIIGREHYLMSDYYVSSDDEILSTFLKQFYIGATYIPSEIVVPFETDEDSTIEKFLSDKIGRKVKLFVPQKGEKLKLLQMVQKNALDMLSKYSESYKNKMNVNLIALEELRDLLGLRENPRRIEAYDISNISGAESVGSMVVFEDGEKKKSDYRKFRIRDVEGINDYGSLKEVLTRRFKRAKENKKDSFTILPDLILMDGGKGQVNIALGVLQDLGVEIPVAGLVIDDFHTTRGIIYENREYNVELDSRIYKLAYKIQEEAHRFAINYHRSLRSKDMFKSELDGIKGIGPKRKKELMKKFKSIDRIKAASLEELLQVEAMDRKSAENLYRHWRK